MAIDTTIKRTREKLLALTDRLSFLAPLLLRVTLGLVFIESGWAKLHSLDNVTEFFASLHIPMPGFNARLTAATELFGGALVLIGLGTRLASLPLAFTMVIAIITAKREEVSGLPSRGGLNEGASLVMSLGRAIIGRGGVSLAGLLARRFSRQSPPLAKPMLRPEAR